MSVKSVPRKSGKGRAFKVRYRDQAEKERSETYELKADADRRDAEIRQAKQRGEPIPKHGRSGAGETFATFAHESWWPKHVEANKLVEKTQKRYATFLDKHLIPRIGDEPIAYIDVDQVLDVRAGLAADKVPDYTAARTLKLLRQVLTFAVLSKTISYNPADILGASKMLPPQGKKDDIRPLLPSVTEAIRRAMLARRTPSRKPRDAKLNLRDATLVSVLAYAGPRPGEALALTWETFGVDQIRAHASKTSKRRTIPKLIKPLMDDIAEWRATAEDTSPKALVFPAEDGEQWTDTAYNNWRKRTWKDCAPDGSRIYDLRHGYAVLLAREGIEASDAAKRMGHSTAMHLQHYEHFIEDFRDKPRESMEAAVLKARAESA
jgi:integrase